MAQAVSKPSSDALAPSGETRILVVDDEDHIRSALEGLLSLEGYRVVTAGSAAAALDELDKGRFHLVMTDLKMAGGDGISLLKKTKERHPDTEVVVLTAYGTIAGAVDAVKSGAHDFLEKPIEKERILHVISKALERQSLVRENRRLAQRLSFKERYPFIPGESPAFRAALEKVQQVAPTDATILLCGESGSGKELVARLIHENSRRKAHPFVAINCGALPETLVESELFGYEKGAFTGASGPKAGVLELAKHGTLFLDEVAEMAVKTQVDFLRVLDQKAFRRVGGTHWVEMDARLVAATNRDLWKRVEEGQFREDLYYRLNVFTIFLPALRERQEDIPILAHAFVKEIADLHLGKEVKLTPDAARALSAYSWPGNVRQLRSVLERLVLASPGGPITEEDVKRELCMVKDRQGIKVQIGLGTPLKDVEKELIRRTLSEVTANRDQAAKVLGISRRALFYKLRRYGLLRPGEQVVSGKGRIPDT